MEPRQAIYKLNHRQIEAKKRIVEAKEEIQSWKEKIKQLKEEADFLGILASEVCKNNEMHSIIQTESGAFCQTCYQSEKG